VLLGFGAILFCRSTAPWQLFPAALVMAGGWACTTTAAISTTLALWFDRRRGLAISLALNGASSAGFIVTPALIALSHRQGLPAAVAEIVVMLLVILIPLVLLGIAPQPQIRDEPTSSRREPDARPSYGRSMEALRDWRFWSVALPFGLALAAQVGFLVHSVALLLPRLGPGGAASAISLVAVAATIGRTGLGLVVDRLDQRRVSAASFASQAGASGIIWAMPAEPAALYAACGVFGLSVGNIITLPSLIIQREFAARSFGFVLGLSTGFAQITFACGPALLGLMRDLAGDYMPALIVCIALDLAAAVIIAACRPGAHGVSAGAAGGSAVIGADREPRAPLPASPRGRSFRPEGRWFSYRVRP
jgi:MFS family permease